MTYAWETLICILYAGYYTVGYLMPPGRPHVLAPSMIRMALTHAVRRGLAASIHTHWRRENLVAGSEGDE
jgi:hypothetical protein